ncbi:hypothetical protein [Bradyrhizobium niftali]|nr:hypothetical protein [Bradyrhizobium niftali]
MDGHCSHEQVHLAGGIVDGHCSAAIWVGSARQSGWRGSVAA